MTLVSVRSEMVDFGPDQDERQGLEKAVFLQKLFRFMWSKTDSPGHARGPNSLQLQLKLT